MEETKAKVTKFEKGVFFATPFMKAKYLWRKQITEISWICAVKQGEQYVKYKLCEEKI